MNEKGARVRRLRSAVSFAWSPTRLARTSQIEVSPEENRTEDNEAINEATESSLEVNFE